MQKSPISRGKGASLIGHLSAQTGISASRGQISPIRRGNFGGGTCIRGPVYWEGLCKSPPLADDSAWRGPGNRAFHGPQQVP